MEYEYLKPIKKTIKFGNILPVNYNAFSHYSSQIFPALEIFEELKTYLLNNKKPDYIWMRDLKSLSEFSEIIRLIKLIKNSFPTQKIGIYANLLMFQNKEMRDYLNLCDIIAISLNSIRSEELCLFYNCKENINLNEIIENIIKFKKDFQGYFNIFTMIFKGFNDNLNDVRNLKEMLMKINPDNVSIGIYKDNKNKSVSLDFKREIKELFRNVPFEMSFDF